VESGTMENPSSTLYRYLLANRDPVESRKLILKLRWIGHETEAKRLCVALATTAPDQKRHLIRPGPKSRCTRIGSSDLDS